MSQAILLANELWECFSFHPPVLRLQTCSTTILYTGSEDSHAISTWKTELYQQPELPLLRNKLTRDTVSREGKYSMHPSMNNGENTFPSHTRHSRTHFYYFIIRTFLGQFYDEYEVLLKGLCHMSRILALLICPHFSVQVLKTFSTLAASLIKVFINIIINLFPLSAKHVEIKAVPGY